MSALVACRGACERPERVSGVAGRIDDSDCMPLACKTSRRHSAARMEEGYALIAVPTGVKIFNWLATMWRGEMTFEVPMLWAVGFIFVFTMGGFTGLILAMAPIDIQLQDTYYVVAHFHYVLVAGSLFGLFAGYYYWAPKWTGVMFNATRGKIHFWASLISFNITFIPMHFLGLAGMPRRYADYPMQFADFNMIASIYALNVEVGRRPKALDERDGAAVGLVGPEAGLPQQVARDHAVHHLQHGRHQLGLCGQQQAQRDGQRQNPLAHRHVGNDVVDQVRRRLRHAPGPARLSSWLPCSGTSEESMSSTNSSGRSAWEAMNCLMSTPCSDHACARVARFSRRLNVGAEPSA